MPYSHLASLLKTSSYINGQFVGADIDNKNNETATYFSVQNPANQSVIAHVVDASLQDVESAIQAAHQALAPWQQLTAHQRGVILRRWFDLLIQNQDVLAEILTIEQGKPLAEAKAEIIYGASFIDWFAEEGKRLYGETIPAVHAKNRHWVIKQGVGVVTAITPWNFPNAMIARKAAAALAAGCTFVVKPSELTPLSALAMAELAQQAGIPAGVFNVVVGQNAKSIGEVLTQHPLVAKFSFTGSTAVGKQLLAQCADGVKKVSMELGGNAPFIVFDDADIDAAVEGAIAAKFRNAGQTCVCANRIYLADGIYDQFVEKFTQAAAKLVLGDGLSPQSQLGPLINSSALKKVNALVDSAIAEGARLDSGGHADADGLFYPATILTKVTQAMSIVHEEIFAPVAPIIRFTSEEQVIRWANDTNAGLAAYFYSQNINRVMRVSEQLAYGMIGINEGIISTAVAPFGGIKQSGMGREGSKYGLDDYINVKYLCLGGMVP